VLFQVLPKQIVALEVTLLLSLSLLLGRRCSLRLGDSRRTTCEICLGLAAEGQFSKIWWLCRRIFQRELVLQCRNGWAEEILATSADHPFSSQFQRLCLSLRIGADDASRSASASLPADGIEPRFCDGLARGESNCIGPAYGKVCR
jgi:hypothetical protein